MRYKNTRTGAVIESYGKIQGGDWREIPAVSPDINKDAGEDQEKTFGREEDIKEEEIKPEAASVQPAKKVTAKKSNDKAAGTGKKK